MKLNQLWLAIDQLANVLLGGYADETISSRAWRSQSKKRWSIMVSVINTLFFWQNNHCRGAYAKYKERKQTIR